MKIALIGASLYNQGAEFVLATVSRGLASRGHDVDVIVLCCHLDIAAKNPDVKPFDIGDKANLIVMKAKRSRSSVFELRRILTEGRYDIVMCHYAPMAIPIVLASVGLRDRPKIVYVEHLGGIGTDNRGRSVSPNRSLSQKLINAVMRSYDAIFAVSKGTCDAVNRTTGYPRDKIFLVPNPAINDLNANNALAEKPSHPWLIGSDIPVIMAAGAFCGVKNFELLIRAFARVRKNRPCRLIIFGEGPFRDVYNRLIDELGIKEFVSLPGFTNRLPSEMIGAACFVVSSYIESFSIVLVEALAAGVPVVATDAPYGPREILKDGKNGILVENNNEEALADGIQKVLDGKGIVPNVEMVRSFTFSSAAQKYEELLMQVCK